MGQRGQGGEGGHPGGGARPMLDVAARSLLATSGFDATVVDLVHGRALKHYREGLLQYLAIRLGDVERAGAAFGEVRAIASATDAKVLTAPPGLRARLFRIAREVAQRRIAESGSAEADAWRRLPWREVPTGMFVGGAALARVRAVLSRDDAEVLELRHARELDPVELAFVLDLSPEDVEDRLGQALARARTAFDVPVSDLPRALLHTFALTPLTGDVNGEAADGGHEALPEGTVIGRRYALEKRVGSGSFGDVYRANDTEVPGHVVALKLLYQVSATEQARGAALRELHLIASVFHPSVLQFKDHGWHEGRLWFVMPWYEGETLAGRISRRPLSRAEARRIFEPLTRALATMHTVGIRHQDIKPDNIFLARIRGFGGVDGNEEILPVLIDLGVAAKEAEMVVAGTPNYFAPEVAAQFAAPGAEHPPITGAADIFSLALTLRNSLEPETQEEVAAGAVESFIEYRASHLPDPPAERDLKFLEPHFARWLSLDPLERPSADELAEELAVLTRPEERRRRRNALLRWLVPAITTLAVMFASVVYVLNARAEREKLEAERARMTASGLRQDLELTRQQREGLEEDVAEIRQRYEQSRLSRAELTSKVARAEGEVRMLRQRIALFEKERDRMRQDLSVRTEDLAKSEAKLAAAKDELATQSTRFSEVEKELAARSSELVEARTEAERAVRDLASAAAKSAEAEAAKRAAEKELAEIKKSVVKAEARAERLERELARARQEIRELEVQLKRATTRRAPVPAGEDKAAPTP